jgi:hypothetical protein
VRNRARFRSGGAAQVSSLPADDPFMSDEKGIYSTYTQNPAWQFSLQPKAIGSNAE